MRQKRFLFMAFDIVDFSKSTYDEARMLEKVTTVFTEWAMHRGQAVAGWYELPVGDELIIAAPESPAAAICFLGFVTRWRRKVAADITAKREPVYVRFALHAGKAIEVATHAMLKRHDRKSSPDNLLSDDLNSLARILDMARPNQVLASDAFWKELRRYQGANQMDLTKGGVVDGGKLSFDRYIATAKHGLELTIYNLLWQRDRGFVGNPVSPKAPLGLTFTGENNYHQTSCFSRDFFRVSEEQLYEYYRDLGREQILSYTEHGLFWRLPFTLAYQNQDIASPSFRVRLSKRDAVGQFTDARLVARHKKFVRASGGKYEENELAAIERISWRRGQQPNVVILRKVRYSDVVSTDLAPDLSWKERDGWVSLRKKDLSKDGLSELGQNRWVPDAVGTTTEIITSDKRLFHPWRSALVHSHPETFTAGASGAVDWKDVDDEALKRVDLEGYKLKRDYEQRVKRKLLPLEWPAVREIYDELRVVPKEVSQVVFLGIGRELLRRAKPNFYFVAYLSLTGQELCKRMLKARERWEVSQARPALEIPQLVANEKENTSLVLDEAVKGNEYNPVTRMALYLLAKCRGALDVERLAC